MTDQPKLLQMPIETSDATGKGVRVMIYNSRGDEIYQGGVVPDPRDDLINKLVEALELGLEKHGGINSWSDKARPALALAKAHGYGGGSGSV
jgi:hypothetical protein